jgi:ABC-type dipeptide/oligopeptide/nickel transport system permease subunit
MKNATEGFAKMPRLPVITVVMLLAFVCPLLLAVAWLLNLVSQDYSVPILAACVLSYVPRVLCCLRFDRAWLACALNPASITLFLLIQWVALVRRSRGKSVQWREREYELAAS